MATAIIETGSKDRIAGPARPLRTECVAVSGGA
ncbi:hypothetical protein QFZ76_003508 [Streptomyces sp. V4I2]|nr:hypothetical protein [Streptomyces sp. V4I2]